MNRFSISGDTCSNTTPALNASNVGTCTVTIEFSSSGIREKTGTLTVPNTGVNNPLTLSLKGT
jgi:hypothetical protein